MPDSPQSLLDNIRLSNSTEGLKSYYYDLLQKDKEKALETINDINLQFGTLFSLRSELTKTAAAGKLNPIYHKALEIVEMLVSGKTLQAQKVMRSSWNDSLYALRWMIKTGYAEKESGIDLEDYEVLMEKSAALLTKDFRDTSALPEIAEMIFERNRSGRLIHELVWAFFEARSPDSLLLIAQRLVSDDTRDVELSQRLLCFIPGVKEGTGNSGLILYKRVLNWLEENKPFLYYTGESLHLCNLPMHYAISLAARYLCCPVSVDGGHPLLAFNEAEKERSSHFQELQEPQQQQLADFSHMLYRKNVYQWNTWMQLPLDRQISLVSCAAVGQEGSL